MFGRIRNTLLLASILTYSLIIRNTLTVHWIPFFVCAVWLNWNYFTTAQKMKFSIKDLFSKFDQILRKLRIWSHLLKKYLMENFIFCAVCSAAILTNFIFISPFILMFSIILQIFQQINSFQDAVLFLYPQQKTSCSGFFMFSGGMERDQWFEMG